MTDAEKDSNEYKLDSVEGRLTINSDDSYSTEYDVAVFVNGNKMEFESVEEGTVAGDFSTSSITFTIDKYEEDGIEKDPEDSKYTYVYKIDGTTLTMSNDDGDKFVFTKK